MIKETLRVVMKSLPHYKKMSGLLMLITCVVAHAQVKPGTNPANKKPAPVFTAIRPADALTDIREKLVTLALQNPDYEIADRKVNIAEYQVKRAKGSWLSAVSAQGNLNEFAFKGSTVGPGGVVTNPSTFYPRYNFGVNLPFNIISDRKNEVKIARENLSIAEAEKNQRFREIKAQVLTKYEDYLLFQQKLDFQTQITQDARATYLSAEKAFQEGSLKQDEYNRSYRSYLDEKTRQQENLRNYNVIKLELEQMIGVSMDDVLKK